MLASDPRVPVMAGADRAFTHRSTRRRPRTAYGGSWKSREAFPRFFDGLDLVEARVAVVPERHPSSANRCRDRTTA
ncbi:hypothetical protein [Streptomyces sp. NBC_00637]|uniref:hypothetical protein n=1 Tax=Streptomyces sp. NBC_00637 TaxID=2903667 RepID=UPI0038685F13